MQNELKTIDTVTIIDALTKKITKGDVQHVNICDICNTPIHDDNLSKVIFKLKFLNRRKRRFKINICKECYNKVIQKFEEIYKENNSNNDTTNNIVDNSNFNVTYIVDNRETNLI